MKKRKGQSRTRRRKTAYETADLNAELFGRRQLRISDLLRSTQHFLTRQYIKDGDTFLDVGGGGGLIPGALRSEVARIRPTIVDPDARAIASGKKAFPQFEFIRGYFPAALKPRRKFDIVSMQALFPQIPDWKGMLLSLRKCARKSLNISLLVRLDGTTVVDKDVSYFYYLDSGQRVHQVIHNIHELVNFCCIREMGVRRLHFYGYHTPRGGHNFRCVPNRQQIKGNLLLEFFERDEDNPPRMGGACEIEGKVRDYNFFVPELDIIIDDKPFSARA